MTAAPPGLAWPVRAIGEALAAVAARSGWAAGRAAPALPPAGAHTQSWLDEWVAIVSAHLGVEAEPVQPLYREAPSFLRHAGPAVLSLEGGGGYLCLLRHRRGKLLLVDAALQERWVPLELVLDQVREGPQEHQAAEVDLLLEVAGVRGARRELARRALMDQRLGERSLRGCWMVRPRRADPLWRQATRARLPRLLLLLAAAHVIAVGTQIASWWVLGAAALRGRFEPTWVAAWLLLLATLVPVRLLRSWAEGQFAVRAGALLRQRLLAGVLRMEPDEVRSDGAGRHFSRVAEVEALESVAITGGGTALASAVDVVAAVWLLGLGASPGPHLALMACVLAAGAATVALYYRRRRQWAQLRLEVTEGLVEKMLGHRTRLIQQTAGRWHEGEDEALDHYLARSRAMDRLAAVMMTALSSGWLVAALLAMLPAVVSGVAPGPLVISVGGALLAFRAFEQLRATFSDLVNVLVSWRQVAPMFHAAARLEPLGVPSVALGQGEPAGGENVMEVQDLRFRYPARSRAVLEGCNLEIHSGDRILLMGPSGDGKSTLASLLTGIRRPGSGLVLLHGLDHPTVGTRTWRRRVAAVPQFHENHVLTGPFLYNLLLGAGWPAREDQVRLAEKICGELGLGPLLDRMPAGLLQTVGDSGWQLSHGERSRLYLARALAQEADVVILDETFAALDPETLERAMECALRRAKTLVVIAHP